MFLRKGNHPVIGQLHIPCHTPYYICSDAKVGISQFVNCFNGDEGKSVEEVVAGVEAYASKMNHIFTVDDLNFLARGGRVSKTSALLGGMLNIKPILSVQDGKLVPIDKIRGQKKAINYMVDYVEKKGGDFSNKIIGICHSNDPELAQTVQNVLQERLSPKEFETVIIGSVIGSHV